MVLLYYCIKPSKNAHYLQELKELYSAIAIILFSDESLKIKQVYK